MYLVLSFLHNGLILYHDEQFYSLVHYN